MSAIETRLAMRAPAQSIYNLASKTDRWPILLPHYRYVNLLSSDGDERTIEMAARRGAIPIRWTAVQRNDPKAPAIYFHHLTGWTKGMDVVWRFDERGGETIVTISHAFEFEFPIAASFIDRHIISEYFIDNVAKRTLAQFKRLSEEIAHV
jgi:ribosome-associated toxin RatA of RatAB toxin-antitoxin module